MRRNEATRIREIIEEMVETLSDKVASEVPTLHKNMKYNGDLIHAGTRINWKGICKRASVDLWDTEENNPDNASSLWEDLMYKQGERIIPETITVGTAFMKDELGWWDKNLYRSLVDNNVYTPAQYESNWEII